MTINFGAVDPSILSAVDTAASKYNIPQTIFRNQLYGESGLNPNVGNSSAGAVGIAQFMPSTAASFGINPHDPLQSIDGAGQYDAQLYAQGGTYTGMLSGYLSGNPNQGAIGSVYQNNAGYQAAYDAAAQYDNGTVSTGTASAAGGNDSGNGSGTLSFDPNQSGAGYPASVDYGGGGGGSTSSLANLLSQAGGAGGILGGSSPNSANPNSGGGGANFFNTIFAALGNFFTRAGLIVLAIILIAIAAWAMAHKSELAQGIGAAARLAR